MFFQTQPKTFVFHHIPKCAGTSMVSLFYQLFSVYKDYSSEDPDFASYLKNPVETRYLNLSSILIGHWNGERHSYKQRYPKLWNSPDVFSFCVLQEPFTVRKSLFRYERPILESRNEKSPNFADHLRGKNNVLSEWIGLAREKPEDFLSTYNFIGFVETMSDQMPQLRRRMIEFCQRFPVEPMRERALHALTNHFPDQMPFLNTSRRDESDEEMNSCQELFEKLNQRDIDLFHAAKCQNQPRKS